MRKVLLSAIVAVAFLAAGWFGARLWPLVAADNAGAEQVVLLHGLGRTERAMILLESALLEAGFEVHNIGYPSQQLPPEQLTALVSDRIEACCAHSGRTVHFVGHSLGGLLTRAYLAEYRPEHLGRVVQLGSPNGGSEIADAGMELDLAQALMNQAGPAAQALVTGPYGFAASLPAPDYPVGVIAGTQGNPLSDRWLPQPNDGLVSVQSARLEGMADFVTVDASHWQLRNRRDVAELTVRFLQSGAF